MKPFHTFKAEISVGDSPDPDTQEDAFEDFASEVDDAIERTLEALKNRLEERLGTDVKVELKLGL